MNHYDQIIPYLKNQLSATERKSLERALETDALLRQSLKEETQLLDALEIQRLRKKITALHQAEKEKVATVPSVKIATSTYFRYALAASMIGLVALGAWYFSTNNQSTTTNHTANNVLSPSLLLSEPIQPKSGNITPLSKPAKKAIGKENEPTILPKKDLYSTVYEEEIKHLSIETLGTSDEALNTIKEQLKHNQVQNAIQALETLQKTTPDNEEVEWLLALAYLKIEGSKATEQLHSIKNKKGKYEEKAIIVLQNIKAVL